MNIILIIVVLNHLMLRKSTSAVYNKQLELRTLIPLYSRPLGITATSGAHFVYNYVSVLDCRWQYMIVDDALCDTLECMCIITTLCL